MGQSNIDKYFSRLEEVFLELVRALHSELANQMVSGITGSQFFVLKKINEKGRMTVSEVAEELGVSLSAITALVNRLVNNSMVVRTRDQTDRRLVWLEATEQGADVVRRCVEGRKKVAEKYFGQLPEKDMEKLIEIYEKVLTTLRSEKAENAAGTGIIPNKTGFLPLAAPKTSSLRRHSPGVSSGSLKIRHGSRLLKAGEWGGKSGRPGQSPVITGRNRGEKGEERTIWFNLRREKGNAKGAVPVLISFHLYCFGDAGPGRYRNSFQRPVYRSEESSLGRR